MAYKRDLFYKRLNVILKTSTHRSIIMEPEKYKTLLEETKRAQNLRKTNQPLSPKQYRRLKRYGVAKVGDSERLIDCEADKTSKVLYYCKVEELYDVLEKAHAVVGHKRTRAMEEELKKQYCNVTRTVINLYLDLCENCELKKKKLPSCDVTIKPILSDCMNSRCQVNIIDMQSEPDGCYRFILNYQDHVTKFTILRPLKTKTAEDVAHQLVDIFCLFGVPCILHSELGCEFIDDIIKSLSIMWPGLKVVIGKPQTQSFEDETNLNIRDMLIAWMIEHNSQNWSDELRFVQKKINSALHSALTTSPYEAMFGLPQKIGLADLAIPTNVYASIETEEDLQELFQQFIRIIENDGQDNQTNEENNKDANTKNHEETSTEKHEKTNGENHEKTNGENHEKTNREKNEKTNGENHEKANGENHEKTNGENHEKTNGKNHEEINTENLEQITKENYEQIHTKKPEHTNIKTHEQTNTECNEQSTKVNKVLILNMEKGTKVGKDKAIKIIESVKIDIINTCVVCKKKTTGARVCAQCFGNVHYICGQSEEDNSFSKKKVICKVSLKRINVETERAKLNLAIESSGSQQENTMCHCKRYCIGKKCKCRSQNLKCNPKCHSNKSCKNK